jgi:ribosome biogenesis GTPase
MMTDDKLAGLGWRPHFAAQLQMPGDDELEVARVIAVHRGRLEVAGQGVTRYVNLTGKSANLGITVGDWVLIDSEGPSVTKRLERFGLFQRRAAGTSGDIQLIAANVDTLFIVTSANRDFNIARLERYLAIAHDAGAHPIIVITKADLVDSVAEFVTESSRLSPGLLVEALDAREADQVKVLRRWCAAGQTVALVGSSGTGKSTIINTLTHSHQDTHGVREDDQRGRHTTTGRSMHELPDGGWLIDTPGMRELQLVDVADALEDVFSDIAQLAKSCRFADCAHTTEPQCAVLAAIAAGKLDADRLKRYRKLLSEDRRNTESLADRRSRDRALGKFYKSVISGKRRERGAD